MLTKIKVWKEHGRQAIPCLPKVSLPEVFRGRPRLVIGLDEATAADIASVCPTSAFFYRPPSEVRSQDTVAGFGIDLGKCVFCGECARMSKGHIVFTNDYRMASNAREGLIIECGGNPGAEGASLDAMPHDPCSLFDPELVRKEITGRFGRSLKLREVSAAGDNSCEMELNASMNVNFDFPRYGVEFVASPRHADGVVVTGPVSANMSEALDICYCSVAEPKVLILVGADAISGGIFAGGPALNRTFIDTHKADLYVPGNPAHPMTFIDGVLRLMGRTPRK